MLNDLLKRIFCVAETDTRIRLINVTEDRVKVEVVGIDIVEVTVGGRSWLLDKEDIRYLMILDGHTMHEKNPPERIGFMLHGKHVEVTDDEWAVFLDELSSIVAEKGWYVDVLS